MNAEKLIMLVHRACVFMFSILLFLKTGLPAHPNADLVLLGFGIYQILVLIMFWPVMKLKAARLLLCASDLLMASAAAVLTGNMASPFLACILIPLFAMHYIYGWKGLLSGLAGLLLTWAAGFFSAGRFMQIRIGNAGADLILLGIMLILTYIVPYLFSVQFSRLDRQLEGLKDKYNDLNIMNSRLLILYEMTGRLKYEYGIAQVMEKLLALCREVFPAQSICIFLIRSGEVEIYGRPAPEEKEEIYNLIMEQKKNTAIRDENEYIIRENFLVIPLIRGNRTDGVLCFNGWKQQEITKRDAVMLTMIANMVSTYLENLEYVETLRNRLLPDTSVIVNQLDSGKPVKGILDKRIVNGSLE